MKPEFNKKYYTIAAYAVIVFVICFALIIVVTQFDRISASLGILTAVISPFIWGFVIAFILNPIAKFFERLLRRLFCRKKERKALVRGLSVALAELVALIAAVGIITVVVSQLIPSVMTILQTMPTYIQNLQDFLEQYTAGAPQIFETINQHLGELQNNWFDYIAKYWNEINNILVLLSRGLYGFLIGFKDFLIGLIVSVYFLYGKERLIAQMKKLVYSIVNLSKANRMVTILRRVNYKFTHFLFGKALDSLIIGALTFICLSIMNLIFGMPYVTLISVIIGVTNMIPFFGPFIGAVPCFLLIFVISPVKAVVFAVFILILQQFDGNILGPKVLGESTGLSSFWTMFAIIVGGGLFGIVGMLISVPIFAVIYTLIKEYAEARLAAKRLPSDTLAYAGTEDPTVGTLPKTDPSAPDADAGSGEKKSEESDLSK